MKTIFNDIKIIITFLCDNLRYCILLYVLIQLAYVLIFPLPYTSDSLYYYKLALSSLNDGSIYPSQIHLNEDYIIAPLFVNLQIFFLFIFKSSYSVGLMQVILNLSQLLILFRITKKYYGKENASVFALLYMFYLPNTGFVLLNMTEQFFGILIGLAILNMLKMNLTGYFLAGVFAASSIAVRPLGWALIIASTVYLFTKNNDEKIKPGFIFYAGVITFIIIFGTSTYFSSSYFVVTSVNHGTNFIISANDDATGAFNDRVFNPGNIGYIDKPESKSYVEKQHYWFDQGVNWLANNPVEWIKNIPLKLVHMFAWDDYAISPLLHMQDWNLYVILKSIIIEKQMDQLMHDVPISKRAIYILLQILHHIYYFLILIIFMYLRFKKDKYLKSGKLTELLLIIIMLSILIPLLSFGDPRFKYPYILFMMMVISPHLTNLYYTTLSKRID